ncbi:MAG: hypothetical protein Q9216_000042 [Gyalolechia sp. 2 TL-2023]
MAEGLPKGLITTNEAVKGNIESVNRVDVEDIARLWKAYHTNRAVLAEDVGQRLENFFWRIWGNGRLLENITGTLVAAIFSRISEGGYIRTTPTQSPRSSRSLGTFHLPRQPEEPDASSHPFLHPSSAEIQSTCNDDDPGDAEETETESPSSSKKKLPPRPPPILKRSKQLSPPGIGHLPGSDARTIPTPRCGVPSQESEVQAKSSDRSSKSTRFIADDISSSIPPHSMSAEEDIYEESTDSRNKSRQKPARRKIAVIASTVANKRRPAMRSRPSQSSSSCASTASPLLSRSEPAVDVQTEDSSSAGCRTRTRRSVAAPVPPRHTSACEEKLPQDHDLTEQHDLDYGAEQHQPVAAGSRSQPGSRTMPRLTSFSSLARKSTAAAAASVSYQASGTMDSGQQSASGEDLDLDEDSADDGNLPRLPGQPSPLSRTTGTMPKTKSQLTLLLQRGLKPSSDD